MSLSEAEIFDQARKIKSKETRRQFLDQVCAETKIRDRIELLLAQDQHDSFLEDLLPSMSTAQQAEVEREGTTIGPYKLLESIAQGGMGTVYLAQQLEPVKRRVAMKLIRPGIVTGNVIARFEAERQALALMEHPNIAKLYDAGTTAAGTPFFVMEYVPGQSVTSYCDTERSSIIDRLSLFRAICAAVQHAHQKGIIHRDLKPSNILVTTVDGQPVPKVIDFGLAKATGFQLVDHTLQTQFGQVMGTWQYMSPEQTGSRSPDIDTRSDIYSLGAILYELLVGSPPFEVDSFKDRGIDEVIRMIRDDDPPTPRQRLANAQTDMEIAGRRRTNLDKINRMVRGDLEWILMRSLEKDPKRRYQTAADFADDIQRFIEHRPVEAAPPSMAYRAKKFVRRNLRHHPMRSGLFAACLTLLVSGVAALYFLQQLHVREMLRNGEAYLARLAEARELLSKRHTPWRAEAIGLLEQAASLDLPNRDDVQLRTLVATTAVQRDLEPIATIAQGVWCDVLAFDPTGKFLAVGQNKDQTGFSVWIYRVDDFGAEPYHLWIDDSELTAERRLNEQAKPEDGARAMCFSRDGRQLAVGTRHGRLHLYQWDGQQATRLATYDPDPGVEVFRIYFSRDGQSLWVLSYNDRLRVIRDGRAEPFPPVGDATIKDMTVSPKEDAVVLIRDHRLVERYEFDGHGATWRVNYDRQRVNARDVMFSRDGRFLFVTLGDSSRYDVLGAQWGYDRAGIQADKGLGGMNGVFSWDDSVVATTSYERHVALWDLAHRRKIASHLVAQRGGQPRIAASPTQPILAVAEHLKVTIFRIGGTEFLGTVAHASSSIYDFATDVSRATIATVGTNNSVHDRHTLSYGVWSTDSWRPVTNYSKHEVGGYAYPDEPRISFSPDGEHLVTVDKRGNALLAPIRGIPGHKLRRWAAGDLHYLEPADLEITAGTLRSDSVQAYETRRRGSVVIAPAAAGKITLRLGDGLAEDFDSTNSWHAYVVCRVFNESNVERISVRASSTGPVSHSVHLDSPPTSNYAFWAGVHQLRTQDGYSGLQIEMTISPVVDYVVLDGVVLIGDKLRRLSHDTASTRRSLGPVIAHRPTDTVWGVFDTEEIGVIDYDEMQLLDRWQNQSTSHVAGLGTLEPLLATDQWIISGTIGGEIFVFDAQTRTLENSAVLAEAEVRGLCQLPGSDLVAAFNDGSFQVLDLPGLQAQQTVKHHRLSVESVCFDPQRQWLFAGGEDGAVSVWRRVDGQFERYFSIDLMLGSVARLLYFEHGDRLIALIAGESALREIRLAPLCDRLREMGLME